MNPTTPRHRVSVIGTPIDALDWPTTLARLSTWAQARESRVVCICNVHSVVTARSDARFQTILRESDMATPDGAPVAWLMRRMGQQGQERINGPDLMWAYCEHAQYSSESVYLYGSSPETLVRLQERMRATFPQLRIAGAYSPPYRQLSQEEDDAVVREISASGAGTVWVSLGCPKQEQWMAAHRGRIPAVMVGVGAAFDYHAGTIRRAPLWMQRHGLEWLHRLASEPRRLWRRYLGSNSVFVVAALTQWVRHAVWRTPPQRSDS
jgi:N-acetylglucosaminyldiphosphoundecaprenol N-acetyl-beta-D-mannosaminyltransferase